MPLADTATLNDRKARARAWFERLRDDLCTGIEAVYRIRDRAGYPTRPTVLVDDNRRAMPGIERVAGQFEVVLGAHGKNRST